ncbi:MAG: hypothetical protein IJD02_05310 [Lachnospiraceae bacterium]|nr:hypothetical protein [Lachnospiraceae bacterium]
MKKRIILFIVITITLGIIASLVYRNSKEEPRFSVHHPSYINGEVVEIINESRVLIKITGDHDGFNVGDKVMVEYKIGLWIDGEDPGEAIPAEIFVGDTIGVQFWGDDVSQEGEYEMITINSITKYTEEGENYRELSKEHSNYIAGKVVEIKDENSVVVEITKERGGYKVGEKVCIKYKQVLYMRDISEDESENNAVLKIDDEISVEVWYYEIEQNEDMDIIEVKDIYLNNWYDLPKLE